MKMSLSRQTKRTSVNRRRQLASNRTGNARNRNPFAIPGVKFDVPHFDFKFDDNSMLHDDSVNMESDTSKETEACTSTESMDCTPAANRRSSNMVFAASAGNLEELRELYQMKVASVKEDPENTALKSELHSALLQAITRKHPDAVRLLLDLGATTEKHEGQMIWFPATLCAVQSNNEEIVDIFIQRGISFVNDEHKTSTTLHAASRMGNDGILKRLLDLKELDINITENTCMGVTPLHVAVQLSKNGCAQLLIEAGADVNRRDSLGRTVLHLAAMAGNDSIVKQLLEHGAGAQELDSKYKMPWFYAIQYGHISTAKLIEEHMQLDSIAEYRLPDGRTLLHQAVQCGNLSAMDYFIGKGCDLGFKDDAGMTLLMVAVSENGPWMSLVVKKLLAHTVCSDTINDVDNRGRTALTMVMESQQADFEFGMSGRTIATILINAGAKVDHLVDGYPILFANLSNPDKREFLIKHGANLNFIAEDGTSALWLASTTHGHGVLAHLLGLNIDMNLTYQRGPNEETPFVAALKRDVSSAKLLYHSGCSLNGFHEHLKKTGVPTLGGDYDGDYTLFIHEVLDSERACGPLSLWELARQGILRCFGQGEVSSIEPKLAHVGLPPVISSSVLPKIH